MSPSNFSLNKSGELYDRALQSLAGGVNSNVRLSESPHPLFYKEALGSRITDVDGNQYIDYVLGQGPMIFGHSPSFLLNSVSNASRKGQLFAGQNILEVEAAEKVQKSIPNAELVRFAGSGTEAVEAALRLARAYTHRNKIVKFEGHYHGWSDSVLFNTASPLMDNNPPTMVEPLPMSEGMADGTDSGLLILPWNNFKAVEEVFGTHGSEIAAVITEPIMCNTNCIMPTDQYLNHLRKECDKNGSLLIFDEVITGFRLGIGGAQTHFGVVPDLATYAKAIGGGFPVSLLTGKKEIMSMIGDGLVMHGGTLNANVMSMAATNAVLDRLSAPTIGTNKKINDLGEQLMTGLMEINSELEVGMNIQGPGPMFAVSFTNGNTVTDYSTHVRHANQDIYGAFVSEMMKEGIRLTSRGIWFLSEAHSTEDISDTLDSTKRVLRKLF